MQSETSLKSLNVKSSKGDCDFANPLQTREQLCAFFKVSGIMTRLNPLSTGHPFILWINHILHPDLVSSFS